MTSIPAMRNARLPFTRAVKPSRPNPRSATRNITTTRPTRNQSQSQPDPRPSRQPGGAHAKHRLFYREFYPPLFRCLAYGTAAYFSLHLLWQTLDSSEQKVLREQEKDALLESVRELRSGLGSVRDNVKEGVKGVKDGVESVKEGVKGSVESVEDSVVDGKKKRGWFSRS